MPRRDKTGPQGQGTMTGRGLGTCNNSNAQFTGRRNAKGRGMRRNYLNQGNTSLTLSLEEEKSILQNRLDLINQKLDQ